MDSFLAIARRLSVVALFVLAGMLVPQAAHATTYQQAMQQCQQAEAGTEVSIRTASGNVKACSLRTQ